MNDFVKNQIPKNFQDDIQRAIQLLKKHGCKEIYLFGSLASGNFGVGSDIDLAIYSATRCQDSFFIFLRCEILHNLFPQCPKRALY